MFLETTTQSKFNRADTMVDEMWIERNAWSNKLPDDARWSYNCRPDSRWAYQYYDYTC